MSLQFTPEVRAQIDTIVRRYPHAQAALLPTLHIAQREFGHLSVEVQALVSRTLDVPPVLVHEVVTFYEMFHQQAQAQFHLEICTNISCHLAGADGLVEHCKSRLGIEVGHQTSDGLFGLMEAECLASCGSAPMMRVGFDYYEYLTPAALDHLLERFRALAPSLHGKAYEMGPEGPHVGPVRGFEPPALAQGEPLPAAAPSSPASVPPKGEPPKADGSKSEGPKAEGAKTSTPPAPPAAAPEGAKPSAPPGSSEAKRDGAAVAVMEAPKAEPKVSAPPPPPAASGPSEPAKDRSSELPAFTPPKKDA